MNRILQLLVMWNIFFFYFQGPATAQYHTHGFPGVKAEAKLNYDSLLAAAVPLSSSETGTKLLENCIEKYGGEDKLKNLKTLSLTYEMEALMAGPHKVKIDKIFQRDRKYKVTRKGITGTEQRILNDDTAWFAGGDSTYVFDSVRYRSELFSYLTLAMPLAAQSERFDEIKYGTREADSLHYIYMDKRDSLMIVIGIDPEDKLIKSSEGYIRKEDGGIVFINRFADFREIDGYIFAHYLINISLGIEVGRSVLIEVEVNPELDDRDFQPSKGTF